MMIFSKLLKQFIKTPAGQQFLSQNYLSIPFKSLHVKVKEYCPLNADNTADPCQALICSCFSKGVMDLRSATNDVY